jgi:5'-3' exonuclease
VVALEHLLTHVVRATRVYLAFDGVVPLAKVVQQRYRRMKRPDVVSAFDKHQLSPGTPFMREMADTLRILFPQIVISDTLEPGEGEHKLFQWLRTLSDTDRRRICIYGLDADLVLISIAQRRLGSIEILRELEAGGFATLSIPAIVEVLPLDPEMYVQMCVLCFGNDFMPNFAMFSLREEGYPRALYFWTHGGLEAAAREERAVLCKRAKLTDRHIVAQDGHALDARIAVQCMDGVLDWSPVVYAFKKTYAWTLHYFQTSEVLDWMWVYPYPDAPLVQHWVAHSVDGSFDWEAPTSVLSVDQHLQRILPVASLPKGLTPLYSDELYDESTDTRHPWMKRFAWESDPYISIPFGPLTSVGEIDLQQIGTLREPTLLA